MNLLVLAQALVMGMVWKMEKKVVAEIKRSVDIFQEKLEKLSATMDTVCISKHLKDKCFILYTPNWKRKELQRQQYFTHFWPINRNLAVLYSKAEFCDGTRNVNKTTCKIN
jgi:hypothetical protein